MFPVVLSSTRGTAQPGSKNTLCTADVSLIPQGAGGASGIGASTLGSFALSVNALANLFNGTNFDVEMDYFPSRTTSGLASPQTVIIFKANLGTHLSIICSAPASTATLDVQVSVDGVNYVDCMSLAANVLNTFDFVGTTPISSTTTLASTNVSNPVTSGGAITQTTPVNPLAFPFIKVVAGAAGAGVATVLTIAVK